MNFFQKLLKGLKDNKINKWHQYFSIEYSCSQRNFKCSLIILSKTKRSVEPSNIRISVLNLNGYLKNLFLCMNEFIGINLSSFTVCFFFVLGLCVLPSRLNILYRAHLFFPEYNVTSVVYHRSQSRLKRQRGQWLVACQIKNFV